MSVERLLGGRCGPPFPIYDNLVPDLLAAHQSDRDKRDATVAHVLATAAGYAYSDIETVATIMSRLGLEDNACVRVAQTVDAMFIFSTAYLVQSHCGRVVTLCYRGTPPDNLGNWLADADVGSASLVLDGEQVGVHSGFHRNLRATQCAVIEELDLALRGRSLSNPENALENPMQALYVTGHSFGGALAALFSLSIAADARQRPIAEKLRAVYTFGQPLTAGEPLPEVARAVAQKVFRHVNARDPIPALPPLAWGRLAHFGHEYRFANGEWTASDKPVMQLKGIRDIPLSLAAFVTPAKLRTTSHYSISDHGPHVYISALRPKGRVTEFGDQG